MYQILVASLSLCWATAQILTSSVVNVCCFVYNAYGTTDTWIYWHTGKELEASCSLTSPLTMNFLPYWLRDGPAYVSIIEPKQTNVYTFRVALLSQGKKNNCLYNVNGTKRWMIDYMIYECKQYTYLILSPARAPFISQWEPTCHREKPIRTCILHLVICKLDEAFTVLRIGTAR